MFVIGGVLNRGGPWFFTRATGHPDFGGESGWPRLV
jgi:hypothetical protein